MFDSTIQRIGFACKFLHHDQSAPTKLLEELQRPLTERSTTVAWLNRQTTPVAEQRLWDIMVHNSAAALALVTYVGKLTPEQRMVRLGSNQLPCATQVDWQYFWKRPDVVAYCEKHYGRVGDMARALDVRLSMHPGQFCVLASSDPAIVNRSIEEFEYHADLIRWMGYGQKFQDFKCNVHISGREGPAGIRRALQRLSTEARNCITIENDENKWGVADSLELSKDMALVLDIHHHLCREAEYISPKDDRFCRMIDSWRGNRPAIHYSYSRAEHLGEQSDSVRPDFVARYAQGYKKGKLRAHSDYFPNTASNEWALSFLPFADIMCEAKGKNLASQQMYNQHIKETT